jgi:hypothetical protein
MQRKRCTACKPGSDDKDCSEAAVAQRAALDLRARPAEDGSACRSDEAPDDDVGADGRGGFLKERDRESGGANNREHRPSLAAHTAHAAHRMWRECKSYGDELQPISAR